MQTTQRPGTVPIRLTVSPEEREQVRVAAARNGLSMAAFARRAVLEVARRGDREPRPRKT